jgi:hypothetical protein
MATRQAVDETDEGRTHALEQVRRWVSRIALTIFTAAFLGLLALSATEYWHPDNEWVVLLDRTLRVSLIAVLAASLPALVLRFGRQLLDSLSGKS